MAFQDKVRQLKAFNSQKSSIKSGDITAGPLGNPTAVKLPNVKYVPSDLTQTLRNNFMGNVNKIKNLGTSIKSVIPKLSLPKAQPVAKAVAPSPKFTPTPTQAPKPYVHYMDYAKYADIPAGLDIPQPPPNKAQLMMEEFDKTGEATKAALAAATENLAHPFEDFVPEKWQQNPNGTYDRGYFHSNTTTFNDLLKKEPYASQMKTIPATKHEDVYNPRVATKVAGLTRKYENAAGKSPWSWWYGWQNKGIKMK